MKQIGRCAPALAAAVCVLLALATSASAEKRDCPRYQKVCGVAGDPPAKGPYRFPRGEGGLTVGEGHQGYFFQGFQLRLKSAAGCSLSGRTVTVSGSHPLRKKGKSTFVGVEETETIFTWRLFKNYVTVKVGSKQFRGRLFAKFTNLRASAGPQMVEGYLKFEPNEEELCRESYVGKP
ncbi:MAG: hypothetical protein H0X42_10560 [Solirubrobacterales bacterium]|nr:hypothetical protein [Solirubrobacterales bacterium]